MRAQVSRSKSDKNSGSRHCRAAGSCQRCFDVDLSNYRCILKSCWSFFVMNRKNFKQAFFHQLRPSHTKRVTRASSSRE